MADDLQLPAAPASSVVDNPWRALRRHTPARIGLGRSGVSLPTAVQLDFQLAHAQARDAVLHPLDVAALRQGIESLGLQTLALHSAAASRAIYLQRPDLGRQLNEASRTQLHALRTSRQMQDVTVPDVAIAVVDGLSALAVQRHAVPLIAALLALPASAPWTLAPVAVVEQGRVAVGDGIGELLQARLVVVLIGERPGLSSPDSLGIYLTWAPRVGRHDAERNCISNVRPEGLGYADAATKLAYLIQEARRLALTGVGLKDQSGSTGQALPATPNFLLGER